MIYLSMDEAGQFETLSSSKKKRCPIVIAGVLFDDNGVDGERAKERKRISQYYQSICKENSTTEHPLSYPMDLHVHTSTKNEGNGENVAKIKAAVGKTLSEFLMNGTYNGKVIGGKRKGKYYVFVIQKSNEGKEKRIEASACFLLNDDYAANLYFHMVDDMLDKVVFHNPLLLKEKEYTLQLATRSTAPLKSQEELAKQLKSQRVEGRALSDESDGDSEIQYRFQLTNADVFRTLLGKKVSEEDDGIKIKDFSVRSIDYVHNNNMEFLYLADSICSFLTYDVKGDNLDAVHQLGENIIGAENLLHFVYDEIDDSFTKAWNYYAGGDYFSSLGIIYDAINKRSDAADLYKKTWFNYLINCIETSGNLTGFIEAVKKFNALTLSNKYDNERCLYILTHLETMMKNIPDEGSFTSVYTYLYMFYDSCVSAYCHIGDSLRAYYYYEICKKYAYMTDVENFLRTQNKVAVFLMDCFEWKKAQVLTEGNLLYHRMISDMKNEIAEMPYSDCYIEEAKTMSLLGQIYALQRKIEAEESFLRALGMMDRHIANYLITESYLLHYYLDIGEKDKYENYANEYFGGKSNIEERYEFVLKNSFTVDPLYRFEFAFYVLVRGIYLFESDVLSDNAWEKIKGYQDTIIKGYNKDALFRGHPYEMINKYLYLIALGRNDPNAEQYKNSMSSCLENEGSLLTAICIFNEIEMAVNEEEKEPLYLKLAEYLNNNFERFKKVPINTDTVGFKVKIQELFSYMYH